MSKTTNHCERITISLKRELRQRIEKRSAELHRSVSQYLRDLALADLKAPAMRDRFGEDVGV